MNHTLTLKFSLSLVLVIGSLFSSAQLQQELTHEALHLRTVSFGNPFYPAQIGNPFPTWYKGNIPIKKDDHTNNYLEPQYTDAESKPVAFVSGSKIGISATFDTDFGCFPEGTVLYIRPFVISQVSGGLTFPSVPCVVNSAGNVEYKHITLGLPSPPGQVPIPGPVGSYPAKVSSNEILETDLVQFIENLEIEWKYSVSLPGNYNSTAGTSINKFYVTHKTRDADSGDYSNASPLIQTAVPHTVIAVGCIAANGTSSRSPILTSILAKFSTRKIKKADNNKPLTYYDNWITGCTTTETLLTTEDGQCASWMRFFLDVLYAQGIDVASPNPFNGNQSNYVRATYLPRLDTNSRMPDTPLAFLIKNFTYTLPQTNNQDWVVYDSIGMPFNISNVSEFGITVIPRQTPQVFDSLGFINAPDLYNSLFEGDSFNILKPDQFNVVVADSTGIAGQGENQNPLSFFANHIFVYMNNPLYYDPSYGLVYGRHSINFRLGVSAVLISKMQLKNEILDGFDYNGNNTLEPMVEILIFKIDPKPEEFGSLFEYNLYK